MVLLNVFISIVQELIFEQGGVEAKVRFPGLYLRPGSLVHEVFCVTGEVAEATPSKTDATDLAVFVKRRYSKKGGGFWKR